MKISVILSTYNRHKTLSETLDCLCKQESDGSFDYEVLIVDNNSKDQTKETIEAFIKKNPRIHYIFEPRQGLSNARNTGIDKAKGEIIAFVDDDVLIDAAWVQNIANFSKDNDFDAIGGKVVPLYFPNTPQWVKDCKDILSGPIVCHDHGQVIKLYDHGMIPFIGANMIIKRKIFKEIGGFNPDLGAGKGTMGEDTEFFFRLKKTNKIIFYNPHIWIHHPVEKNRMSLLYIAKWNIASGKYLVIKDYSPTEKDNLIYYFGVPRYLFPQIIKLMFSLMLSIGERKNFVKLWGTLFWKIGMVQAYQSKVDAKSGQERLK